MCEAKTRVHWVHMGHHVIVLLQDGSEEEDQELAAARACSRGV